MIYLIGLTLSCFLIILILLKKQKQRADYVLAFWMLTLSFHLLLVYMQHTRMIYNYPHALGLLMPLPVLHGLFLFTYASELTGRSILTKHIHFLYLLPFLALVALAIPFYSLPAEEKISVFKKGGEGFEWYSIIQLVTIVFSGMAFSAATLIKIKKYRTDLLNYFSDTEKKILTWLEYMAIGLAIIWMLAVFFDDAVIFYGVILFVLFVGIFGINQVPVFYSETLPESAESVDLIEMEEERISDPDPEKYARTGLKDEEAAQLMEQLEILMQTAKPFTNGELTLNDLASLLECHPNQLSQVINSMYGKTFYHYINQYRVKEFLEMTAQPGNEKFTFIALAYDCGFNSKTTFNKYFKLHTGKTPSQYFASGTDVIHFTEMYRRD